MIRKEEWDAAYRRLIVDGRRDAGPPPSFEEVEALSRGELSEQDAERVRAALACYPDLLRVFSEPFPQDAAEVLSGEQLADDLAKIRERVRRSTVQPLPASRRRTSPRGWAIAAGLAIAIAAGSIIDLRASRPNERAPRRRSRAERERPSRS